MIQKVQDEVERQLNLLPRKEIAQKALENSRSVLVDTSEEMMALSNAYAPEHLIIQTKNYGTIEISPATIGVANAVMDWGIKQERAQKKWDNSLVSLIPFLVRDWRTLT
jgi:hypothetical protein